MALIHFLLVYDHDRQRLIDMREFRDGSRAAEAYAHLEAEHRGERNLEIVLVGADSEDTIRLTHGHYFEGAEDSFKYLAGVS